MSEGVRISRGPAPERRRRGLSIVSIAMLLASTIVVLAVGVFAWSMMNYLTELSRGELEERGRLVVAAVERSISQDLALDDRTAVVQRCAALVNDTEDLEYIVVTLRDGSALVHTADGWEGADGGDWKQFEGGEDSAVVIPPRVGGGGDEVLQFSHEISYLTSLPLGWVHLGLSMEHYRENLRELRGRTWYLALVALCFGVPASLFFGRQIARPITRLQDFAKRIAAGDLSTEVRVGGSKEIVHLSETMNWMSRRLADSRQQLESSLREQAALREKEVLLREIHHRVKNNMQVLGGLIRIQCRGLESEEARAVLIESETRIRSMALLHQKLYQSESISEISLAGYVRVLVDQLRRLYGETARRVRAEVEIDDGFCLGLDTALPCGLIVNELVSNSFKYAFAPGAEGTIRVRAGRGGDDGRFVLEVADDGIGLPADFDPGARTTLGMRLVTMLVEQLDGKLTFDGHAGSRFRLDLRTSEYTERLQEANHDPPTRPEGAPSAASARPLAGCR